MQEHDQGRTVLIGVMIAGVILVLFVASFGVVFLVANIGGGGLGRVPPPPAQVAVLATASPVVSATLALSSSTTITTTVQATQAPSATELPQPTGSSTVPVPTLPPPSATSTTMPTAVPAPTVPVPTATAVPAPTVPVPTATAVRPTVPPAPTTAPPPAATPVPPTLRPIPTATAIPPVPTVSLPTPTPALNVSRVTVPQAIIYDGPSLNNSIIGAVERGDELVVLGSSGTWYLVRMNGPEGGKTKIEGGKGWIRQDQVSQPGQPVPVITP